MEITRREMLLSIEKNANEFWCTYQGHFVSHATSKARLVLLVLTDGRIRGERYQSCDDCYMTLLQNATAPRRSAGHPVDIASSFSS